MNKMKSTIVIAVVTALVVLLIASSVVNWSLSRQDQTRVRVKDMSEARNNRFVGLDKIVVMLQHDNSGVEATYIAIDLVFRTSEAHESEVKRQLPFLKSIAVRALSKLTITKATAMTIEDYQHLLTKVYDEAFTKEGMARPFSELMVSRLIIE